MLMMEVVKKGKLACLIAKVGLDAGPREAAAASFLLIAAFALASHFQVDANVRRKAGDLSFSISLLSLLILLYLFV